MDLLILGSSAATPAAGDACSGYLVTDGNTNLLLDCGPGVLGKLLLETTIGALSAIVISHFHPDHYLDLAPMRYGIVYGGIAREQAPILLLPPGGTEHLCKLGMALRGRADMFADAFRIAEYDPKRTVRLGGLRLAFQRTAHDVPAYACRVTGASSLVYTADSGRHPPLTTFAAGADLLLSEATYPSTTDRPTSGHLTGVQAGTLAREAGVGSLVLTHFWPGYSRDEIQAEAEAAYGRSVLIAAPLARFSIPPAGETSASTPK